MKQKIHSLLWLWLVLIMSIFLLNCDYNEQSNSEYNERSITEEKGIKQLITTKTQGDWTKHDLGPDNSYAQDIFHYNGDVYTVGYYWNGSEQTACYWKNNVKYDLGPGKAVAIARLNNRIYIAGTSINGACYWIISYFTMRVDLGDSSSNAVDIYVTADADAYIAGRYYDEGTGLYVPCYWKNRTRYTLYTLPHLFSTATGISVLNGDVYVSGFYYNPTLGTQKACYWKNSNRHTLSHTGYASATDIYISDDDVYISGTHQYKTENNTYKTSACYWKNRVYNALNSYSAIRSYGTCIYVRNNNVFIGGKAYIGIGYPMRGVVWINGEYSTLLNAPSYVNGISATQENIYLAGYKALQDGPPQGAYRAFYAETYFYSGLFEPLEPLDPFVIPKPLVINATQ